MTTLNEQAANPWETQRNLMRASDQRIPAVPTLSKEGVLYTALVMEEASETIRESLVPALGRFISDMDNQGAALAMGDVRELLYALRHAAASMHQSSLEIRHRLAGLAGFSVLLTLEEADKALDGVTDVTVVNCGLALALGLPGAGGYAEGARSNASKANPDTGRIEKDAGGKWIKGRNYSPADFGQVLLEAFPGHCWPPQA